MITEINFRTFNYYTTIDINIITNINAQKIEVLSLPGSISFPLFFLIRRNLNIYKWTHVYSTWGYILLRCNITVVDLHSTKEVGLD